MQAESQAAEHSQVLSERDRLQADLEAFQQDLQRLTSAFARLEQQLSASTSQVAGLLAAAAQSEQNQADYVNQVCAYYEALLRGRLRLNTRDLIHTLDIRGIHTCVIHTCIASTRSHITIVMKEGGPGLRRVGYI